MATFKIKMPKCNECDCVINDGDGNGGALNVASSLVRRVSTTKQND